MSAMRFGDPEVGGPGLWFSLDGERIPALPGDTIATALYAAGKRAWRWARNGDQRGLLCGIGLCFDCLVTVDGTPGVRACLAEVRAGMLVQTGPAPQEPV